MVCKHQVEVLPLYARNQKSGVKRWISSRVICGDMIYVCMDCGTVIEKTLTKKRTLTMKKEVNENG
ncbi:hypothetical protein LCGC14_3151810 [marine sediment metagenome]|uniref:Uncharacterized protein n=1 Tax=marine sediment metagenome TaxID=412755 RepID=A0A0F8VTW7_9ZZZZ